MNTNYRWAGMLVILTLLSLPITAVAVTPVPQESELINETIQLPVDLVDERPNVIGLLWSYSKRTVGWMWNLLNDNIFAWIVPPNPGNLSQSVSKKDANQLFKLLGYAGYKLKEINTDVGLIPGLNFKFIRISELSEADYEYLESMVEEWEHTNPGMYAALQRKIIKTITSVNTIGDYRVSALKVVFLPLPDVSFVMSHKDVYLGEENGMLMRGILRLERELRDLTKDKKIHN